MSISNRDRRKLITIVYTIAFLDLFSASMITTCLPTYLTDTLGMSATTAGTVGSIYGIVQFFSSPIIGCWSDHYGYRKILSLCLFLCVPAYFLLSCEFWAFVICSRILAGSFKHTQTLSRTYLATFATDSEKMQAYGRLNAMGNIGFVIGPAAEAWLLANYGYSAVFYCTSLVFLINAVLVGSLLSNRSSGENPTAKPASSSIKSIRPSFHFSSILTEFRSSMEKIDWSRQWDLILTRFLLSFAVLLYRSSYSWMLQDKFHLDPASIGYLTSYQGVVAFLTSISTGYIAMLYIGDTVRLYEHVILLNFLALLGLILSGTITTYTIFLAPFCVSTSIMRVVTLELTTERADNSDVGLLLGVSASSVSMARAFSPVMGGILHDWHPDATAVFCLGMVIASWAITNVYTRWYSYNMKENNHD